MQIARMARTAAGQVGVLVLLGCSAPAHAGDLASQARAMAAALLEGGRFANTPASDSLPEMQLLSHGLTAAEEKVPGVGATGANWSLAADPTSRDTVFGHQISASPLAGERYIEVSYAPGRLLPSLSVTAGLRLAGFPGFGILERRSWYGRAEHSFALSRRTRVGVVLAVQQAAFRGVPGSGDATLLMSHELTREVTASAYVGRNRTFDGYTANTAGLSLAIGF